MRANAEAGVPAEFLTEYPRWDVRRATLLESTPDFLVEYEPVIDHGDGTLHIRKTVWLKAHRSKDRHIVWQGSAAMFTLSQIPGLVRAIVQIVTR